jgi:hypothetical protein
LIEQYLSQAYQLPTARARAHFSRDEAMTLAFLKALTPKTSKAKTRANRSRSGKTRLEQHSPA